MQPDFCILSPVGKGWIVTVTTGTGDMTLKREGTARTTDDVKNLLASWNYTPKHWTRHPVDHGEEYRTAFLARKDPHP